MLGGKQFEMSVSAVEGNGWDVAEGKRDVFRAVRSNFD